MMRKHFFALALCAVAGPGIGVMAEAAWTAHAAAEVAQ
jgi:hypothetical protein